MDHEAVWKRAKMIERELEKLAQKIKPLCSPGKIHGDAVDQYIQQQYVRRFDEIMLTWMRVDTAGPKHPPDSCLLWYRLLLTRQELVTERKGVPAPQGWAHAHNNHLMAFRMYYKGAELDTDLPPPAPIKDVVVPVKKPQSTEVPYLLRVAEGEDPPPSIMEARKQAADIRCTMLKEVRLHMDLLKDFEGIIPATEIEARKRQLFSAMPDAPPPLEKRQKLAEDSSGSDVSL
jgi:hypothetical protein